MRRKARSNASYPSMYRCARARAWRSRGARRVAGVGRSIRSPALRPRRPWRLDEAQEPARARVGVVDAGHSPEICSNALRSQPLRPPAMSKSRRARRVLVAG
jgi:hypothetical protein